MASIGELLQRARLERGLDLGDLSALTRINAKYLQAIEADDRRSLPSGFFYKSFVHQYAKTLGLDTEFIDAQVEALLSQDDPLPLPGRESAISKQVPPVPTGGKAHPLRVLTSIAALTLVLLGCSGIYLWWRTTHTRPQNVTAMRGEVAAPEETTAQRQPVSHSRGSLAMASKAPQIAPRPPRTLKDIAGYKLLVDLMARELTWLSVSSDGKPVFSGTLGPNQSRTVEGNAVAKVKVGNAAGLEIRLNGKLLGTLGEHGQVLTVILTPDEYHIVPPPAPRQGDDDESLAGLLDLRSSFRPGLKPSQPFALTLEPQ